jgi:hypothetical protein
LRARARAHTHTHARTHIKRQQKIEFKTVLGISLG